MLSCLCELCVCEQCTNGRLYLYNNTRLNLDGFWEQLVLRWRLHHQIRGVNKSATLILSFQPHQHVKLHGNPIQIIFLL